MISADSSLLIGFYNLQIFAGMRTQHTSTLRQAQPRRGAGCLKRPSVSRHSTFIWLFRFVTCHRYMMAFVTFRGTVITFVTAIGPVLWYDLSHRSLLHQLKQFTDIKSWDELSKKGSFSKKRNVMFSTKKLWHSLEMISEIFVYIKYNRGLETWKNQPRLFVPFP